MALEEQFTDLKPKSDTSPRDVAMGGGSLLDDPDFGSLKASQRRQASRMELNQQVISNKKRERAIRVGYRHALKSGNGAQALQLIQEGENQGLQPFGIRMAGQSQRVASSQIKARRTFEEGQGTTTDDELSLQQDLMRRFAEAQGIQTTDPGLVEFQDNQAPNGPPDPAAGQLSDYVPSPAATSGVNTVYRQPKQPSVTDGFLNRPRDASTQAFPSRVPASSQGHLDLKKRVQSIFAANPTITTARDRQILLNSVLGRVGQTGNNADVGGYKATADRMSNIREEFQSRPEPLPLDTYVAAKRVDGKVVEAPKARAIAGEVITNNPDLHLSDAGKGKVYVYKNPGDQSDIPERIKLLSSLRSPSENIRARDDDRRDKETSLLRLATLNEKIRNGTATAYEKNYR